MGVSLSRALWSPSVQARRSLLISSTAGSPGSAAPCIVYGLELYHCAVLSKYGVFHDPLLSRSAPTWSGRTNEKRRKHEIHATDFDVGGELTGCTGDARSAGRA